AFSATSDGEFVEALSHEINTRQWIRWFALKEILNDREGGLSLERGDDYYIYKNPGDDLFYLLPWDQDTVIVRPFEAVHHHGTPAVRRLLRHPELARFYYAEILNILDYELTQEVMDSIIDRTAPVAGANHRAELKQIFREERAFLYAGIPRTLTVQADNTSNALLVKEDDAWRFFRGVTAPPADWKQNGFDDSGWESGPGGFGYGDNDDRTVLSDMQNNYSTVFIRKTFSVPSPESYKRLILKVRVDDGFVAYLNGVEVARLNVNGEPAYRSTAPQSLEAGESQSYFITNPGTLLVPGGNTLAVVGVNVSLPSSDLTLAVQLEGEALVSDFVRLHGLAPAALTTEVRINGSPVAFVPWKAEWELATGLVDGRNLFQIEALDAEAQVVDATRVVLYHNAAPPTDGVEIEGDEYWPEAAGPVWVERNIIVPPTDTLTIGAGVTVQMASGAAIIVYGTMAVEGTNEKPVQFVPGEEGGSWGGIAVAQARGVARFSNARFRGTRGFSFRGVNYPAAVNVRGSSAVVENSFFTAMDGLGIEAWDSRVTVTGNHFLEMGEMLHCARSYARVEGNRFENVRGYSDAIDFDEGMDPASAIRGNTILGTEDDGIDLLQASIRIEGNWIQRCHDKGISLEGQSTPVLINNVILDAGIGVAVKDACQARLVHSTIVSCTTGIDLYEKNPGMEGGQAEIINTVVWYTEQSLRWDEKSALQLVHCDLMQLPDGLRESNESLDPLFEDPGSGRFMPQPDSPLIDSGVPAGVETDITGQIRPQGKGPDIGAYEFFVKNSVKTWTLHY
ncbi:MAG TPA: right-handed parallel beta-helix repeat-containing protein, partial [bacterium]|nr:right-handed parallel beta-helix repeat-containing protein [bacterium]